MATIVIVEERVEDPMVEEMVDSLVVKIVLEKPRVVEASIIVSRIFN